MEKEDDDQEKELPPALIEKTVPCPVLVDRATTLEAVIDADVEVANQSLLLLHSILPSIRSISTLLSTINTTMSVIEKRRKLLNLQYGYTDKNLKDAGVYTPD